MWKELEVVLIKHCLTQLFLLKATKQDTRQLGELATTMPPIGAVTIAANDLCIFIVSPAISQDLQQPSVAAMTIQMANKALESSF